MASDEFINHSNDDQVRYSHCGQAIHRRSKTIMCLHKILRIISSFSPPETPTELAFNPTADATLGRGGQNRCLFDLNLQFGAPETENSEFPAAKGEENTCIVFAGEVADVNSPLLSVGFTTAKKRSDGECYLQEVVNQFQSDNLGIGNGVEAEIIGNKSTDKSCITKIEVSEESKGKEECNAEATEEKREVETKWSNRSLDLLIEAAKLISDEFEDGEPEPTRPKRNHELESERVTDEFSGRRSKRRRQNECFATEMCGDFEDASPVVRSKRGRNQVLPYKYRDSVLEPLSRHRSASVSTRRISR